MGSVDVNSLFTNIRLEETIDNCNNTLFENTEKVEGLSKLESSGTFTTKVSYFIFNGKLYKQADGAAMGSSVFAMGSLVVCSIILISSFLF